MKTPIRVAWIGDPGPGGGVGGFCRQLVQGLVDAGVDLGVFTRTPREVFDDVVGPRAGEALVAFHPPEWEWDRWYSRSRLGAFLSSSWARRRAYRRVVDAVIEEHAREPFDVIVQFSQGELFETIDRLHELPPLLLFPCVHAAGELRWHRTESRLALRGESWLKHMIVRSNLKYRASLQRRSYRAASGVIGMSRRFNELVAMDYGVEPQRQAVVHQPIDEGDPVTHEGPPREEDAVVKLLYVGRVVVRKGVELLVELSHRLEDLAGQVRLEVVGGPSTWSDYRPLLADVNPAIASVLGERPHEEVTAIMDDADALIVPSHYEPGGIVVAEALARGCVVVATDQVGSAEPLPEDVCLKFPSRDVDALERHVRTLVEYSANEWRTAAARATRAAQECFDATRTTEGLVAILERAVAREPIGGPALTAEASPS